MSRIRENLPKPFGQISGLSSLIGKDFQTSGWQLFMLLDRNRSKTFVLPVNERIPARS